MTGYYPTQLFSLKCEVPFLIAGRKVELGPFLGATDQTCCFYRLGKYSPSGSTQVLSPPGTSPEERSESSTCLSYPFVRLQYHRVPPCAFTAVSINSGDAELLSRTTYFSAPLTAYWA
ncbi:uncharacterized protein LOC118008188 [Mirounga leonina]|uniref:uncharacterized protein LOC118008188 n=1 Tax=Mirounga leonina TaxID=9715 RepID=UPI00156BFDBA|nr:uncharacterized protein LOC118008188 [Mirounga leonina]